MKDGNNKGDTSNRGCAPWMRTTSGGKFTSKGGKAAHELDSEEARAAGRNGGETVSRDREHMSHIGRKGGKSSHGRTHEDHVKAGSQSHRSDGSGSGSASHSRGGSPVQDTEADRQSHKNR